MCATGIAYLSYKLMRRTRSDFAESQKYDGPSILLVISRKAHMSTWYKLALGNDDQAFEPTLRIQQMFMSKFLMCPPGSGRALFSCYDKEKDNLCLYFSPAAADIALRVYAEPCDPPTALDCIGLLAGEGDALGVEPQEWAKAA